MKAAAAGKKIFCEKPLDLELQRARSAAVQLEKAVLLMGSRRFDPHFQSLKTRLDWRRDRAPRTLSIVSHDPLALSSIRVSGGLFKDVIHDFDTARWLMREDFEEVQQRELSHRSCIAGAGDVDTGRQFYEPRPADYDFHNKGGERRDIVCRVGSRLVLPCPHHGLRWFRIVETARAG